MPNLAATQDQFDLNLKCLASAQPALVERLCWPVEGDHLSVGSDGHWVLKRHHSQFPAQLNEQELRHACNLLAVPSNGTILIFGTGLGELPAALLKHFSRCKVIAWERDPWTLRQALSTHDWSEPIRNGRLRFALNADLIEVLSADQHDAVCYHPLFARIYNNERQLLADGIGTRRALVCNGGLFVESLADALRDEGYSVFSFDVERVAAEELDLVIGAWGPGLVAGINHVNGLAEFCQARDLDHLCWEIDPAVDEPRTLEVAVPRTKIFTFREVNVDAFKRAGFSSVSYLPLAADPGRREPVELTHEQRARYGAGVSFVGASLMHNVEAFQETFVEQLTTWRPNLAQTAMNLIAEVISEQRLNLDTFRLPDLLDARLPGFRNHSKAQGWPDPALLLGEVSAAEKRLNYMAELGRHDLVLWGDAGWRQLEAHGARYKGLALHETELPLIYSASTINVDIGRLYQDDIVTMRIFDILACGGFVLAEHTPALAKLFDVGNEVESYQTLEELKRKVAHYLENPEQARAIADRGREAVLKRHTIRSRVQRMLG